MVKVKDDLTGRVFGRLTVIKQAEDYVAPNGRHFAQWECMCNCGNDNPVIVRGNDLKNGHTRSCGCLSVEATIERSKRYNVYSEMKTDQYGDYYIGYTSNTNKEFYIDADDYDKVCQYCWREVKYRGMSRLVGWINKNIYMHVFLGYKHYDHIDRNELNNRKYNLRKCTQQENCINSSIRSDNTSGIIGVAWNKAANKWKARLTIKQKEINLGYFINKKDAIKARLQAEAKYFKEFAPQQHLFKEYGIEEEKEIC
jgi:hypothetical protein